MAAFVKNPLLRLFDAILSVPVRIKIIGIVMLPVLILGFTLNYWITSSLSDWLSYMLSDQRVAAAMAAGNRSVLFVTFLAAVGSTLFSFVLTFLLTRPLLDLRQVAHAVSGGQLQSRARVWAHDEIGEVAAAVNQMIDRLVADQAALAQVNQRLETINDVIMAAGRELGVPEVLEAILQGFERLGFAQGWVYLRDSDTSRFYLAHERGLPPALQRHLQEQGGESACSCQEALAARQLSSAAVRPGCARLAQDLPAGAAFTHISVPLRARGQFLGIVNLLCPQGTAPSAGDLELFTAIGAQAAEIVANAWLHARLVEKESARRALLESLVRTQEDERTRLARELHDGAGQTLTTLLVRLKALEKQAPPGAVADGLGRLQALTSDSIEQVRELSYQLHPAALEAFGLARALDTLVTDVAGPAGLEVHKDLTLRQSLPLDVQTGLYRIAQESLTNILRHAGARRVEVELVETPYGVALRIEDDGRGFDPDAAPAAPSRPHMGLISMQERAELLGGSLTVFSAPGAGTSVQVRVPVVEDEVTR
jgi:signal transduction histidine kinase